MTPAETMGARLRQRRIKAGLSGAALAALLGVADSTVYRWEAGTRAIRPDHLSALSRELNCRPAWFLRDAPQ